MYSQAELGLESASFYMDQIHNLEQVADNARRAGETRVLARATLDIGRVKEKLQEFAKATALAETARKQCQNMGDTSGFALCCHTLAVWAFHQGEDDKSVHDFCMAAETRERIGELLMSAQSWHNLGYVHCRGGRANDAFHCYWKSRYLLDRLRADQSEDLSVKAERSLGFVLSHLAFASAKYRCRNDALTATVEYLEHVARTGVHREPLLAYLAPPIALALGEEKRISASSSRLEELTDMQMQPEVWFRFALDEGSRALIEHKAGSGRRPYLGARLLTLTEYGSWCLQNERTQQGQALFAEAVSLARARGWKGEARRCSHVDVSG